MKSLLAAVLFVLCLPLVSQTAFEEIEFEADSTARTYKPSGKNYVNLKSKRGSSGMNKTPLGDAIVSAEVTEIVLVFSELDASAISEREDANHERWENLYKTYPEYFQFSTTYKNVCQCNTSGDAEAFKAAQGFYIYIAGEVPKVDEPKAPEPVAPVTKAVEPPAPTPAPTKPVTKTEEPVAKAPKAEENKTETPPPPPPAAPVKEAPVTKAKEEPTASEEEAPAAEVSKPTTKKKTGVATNKPRKAKDKKACRPACYGFGDEDLHVFFKENMNLSKKEKKKSKKWVCNVKLQIHFDGVVKKAMVTGSNEVCNQKVDEALKLMNKWNCAVKNGVAVKSEVKFTLKYDKASKSLKPFDILANPKPSAKCPCVTDSEIFD